MTGTLSAHHLAVQRLCVQSHRVGDTGVVELVGEIDLANEHLLCDAAFELVGDGCRNVVVDCDGLTYIDSSGIRALVQIHHAVHERHGSLTIRRASGHVCRLLELMGLTTFAIVTGVSPD